MSKNMMPQLMPDWIPEIYNYSAIFSDLELLLGKGNNTTNKSAATQNSSKNILNWPDCQTLMTFIKADSCSFSGSRISMHPQDKTLPYPHMSYEERIYQKGIISTREQNWHDFFNAMIWGLFPQTKKLLNLLHIKEMQQQSTSHRTLARDAITHLDESGIIIVSSQPNLLEALKQHQWLEVFYQQRDLWSQSISAFVFGHGMYEKALKPFIGFTGKMYPLIVTDNFFKLGKIYQYKQLDKLLSEDIKKTNAMKNNKKLTPLPILGVPGWYGENKLQSFYLNTNYFRPLR